MDELQRAAEDGDFNLFKQIESEMEEKNINWDECYGSAFTGGNINIVRYCEEKGAESYSNFELAELEADSTLEGWKSFMLRAAEEGNLNMLMYCELMIEEKYQCILGLKNYKIESSEHYAYIQKDEDDFYEKDISISQGSVEDLMNPLPFVRFDNDFSTILQYRFSDLIVRGKEGNKIKMIEFLREVLRITTRENIREYLNYNLRRR
uniref:Ankyrin repeat protein n=1 Tax=Pithovirus LCPAC406 TaxID=2506599 RepID=A0A481ZD57_9VIRU|nr:MAG: uncharacterized protein LCPAC406_00210 [Pithovirus LCPAC406]